ncbi:hypothetical protein M407DRAFT_213453 [Tulasnella calospora MUT 4182]|uniref:C2H2-type domain-containing protein n=1 Tax=Tulasnella calospora MUT 4182 TaxID=1051891 RepID=A0A0C3QE31_9AGAM|nr:hypothetical protein M407DRAFT_213453 [Tulasnella calospora MUT 4182]
MAKRKVTAKGKKKEQCRIVGCRKWLSDRRARDVHENTHGWKLWYKCRDPDCPKWFPSRSSASRCKKKHRTKSLKRSQQGATHPAYVVDGPSSSAAAAIADVQSTDPGGANAPAAQTYGWVHYPAKNPEPDAMDTSENLVHSPDYSINFS